jgi:hypothetical protein
MQDGKLPVIVGGTNYYIESLLWKVLVENPVERMQLPSNAEEANSGGSSDGRTQKEHVGDSTESLSIKKIVLGGDDMLLDVTCQKEGLGKYSFGAKCRKRVLDCDDEILCTKCQKLQTCEEDIDHGSDRPKPVITEFQNKDFLSGDVEEQSQLHSGNVGRDQLDESSVLKQQSRDDCVVDDAGSSTVCSNVKMCCKTGCMGGVGGHSNEQVVSLHNRSPGIEIDSELVCGCDKNMMQEAPSDENTERRKLRMQDVTVDLMDETALEHLPSPQLYEMLQSVDPDMAQGLHPNNKRRIIR